MNRNHATAITAFECPTRPTEGIESVSPFDTRVPAALLRIDRNPFHHGTLGAVRSLGRAGVEVHVVAMDDAGAITVSRIRCPSGWPRRPNWPGWAALRSRPWLPPPTADCAVRR